jgi:5'-phosphate synthase pdxT subunit
MTRIGVLALQGDFIEHEATLRRLGVETRQVRRAEDLRDVQGLIIPGGESTTISKLMALYDLMPAIRQRVAEGMPILGTCAGMIVMAKEATDLPYETLGLMDIKVRRNAFGRQIDSFEADLPFKPLGTVRGVFIRAPIIERVGEGVEVLGQLQDGTIVAAQQGRCLALAFHPELTEETGVHRYFLEMIEERVP